MITARMLEKLKAGELSWNKAKEIIKKTLQAPAGREKEVLEQGLNDAHDKKKKPLTFKSAIARFSKTMEEKPRRLFTVAVEDMLALVLALQGKNVKEEHIERVRKAFPGLVD